MNEKNQKVIGVLTSGGDAPGMNAAVRSVVRTAIKKNMAVMGIRRGYNGLINGDMSEMNIRSVSNVLHRGGTMLLTARCNEFKTEEGQMQAVGVCKELGIDGLVIIGGDGSFMGARALANQGIPCVGIPGTIDNDLGYTEATLGYDTAVNVCVEAVRSIRATSRSHDRPHVVQVMGRNCGDIAMKTAIATGAETLVVPEMEWDVDEVAARLNHLIEQGNTRATLVISEHCWDNMKPFDWRKFLNDNARPFIPANPSAPNTWPASSSGSATARKCAPPSSATPSAALSPPRRTAPLPLKRAIWPCSCSTGALPIRPSVSAMAACSTCRSPTRCA